MRARKTEQALGRAGLGEDAWCSSAHDSLHQAGRGEEEKKNWGVTKESRFSAAVLFGSSLGVSGRLTTLESRMQSYNKGRKEEREGGGSITCSSNHTLRQKEKNIKMGENDKG